jgi:hypothetical protein
MSNWNSFWLGMGVKGGGTIVAVGAETMDGNVTNMGFIRHSQGLNLSSIRVGTGLGGGVGLVAILVFDCPNLRVLHDTYTTDWSINIAMGPKWDGVLDTLKGYKFFATLLRLSGKIIGSTPEDLTNLRNAMSYFYQVYDISKFAGPTLITIDIPFAGIGQEASIHALVGQITIGELVDSAAKKKQRPEPVGGLPGRKY